MPDQYYDSPLTGQQLDAAFQQMQGIEQTASQVQSNASAAAQSASQASSSASAASSSATRAGQSATQAQNSASAASSSASAAAESARQAADCAASIEGDAEAAAQSASNAQGHATAAQGSASAAAASASAAKDSEDAAEESAGTAQSAAAAAAQSERNAKTSETNAASSASAAQQAAALIEDNLAAIQAAPSNAQAAQNAAAQAAQSASDAEDAQQAAENSKTAAASSASAAAKSAEDAEEQAQAAAQSVSGVQPAIDALNQNMDAIVNAESNAQAAAQSASAAAQSAQAAEDAAERAEQIADFDPASFATAAQGEKADTAVQSVNGKSGTAITLAPADVGAATAAQGSKADTAVQPDTLNDYALKTDVPTTPADIGAATADQGAKADTALQPGALDGYALKTDIPDELPNPQPLTIQLGSSGSPITYDGSTAQSVTITPEAVGAAPKPLIGNLDDITPAQVRDALQAGRQVVLLDDGDVLTEWEVVENSFGTVLVKGSYSLEHTISSVKGDMLDISYCYGNPNSGGTWNKTTQSVLVLPEVSRSNNGQALIVQSGYWQPGDLNAAPEPLTGNLDDVTPAQVRAAIQAGRQVSLLKDDDILAAWVDTGLNVQCLYGWNIGNYANRPRAICLDAYYGDPNGDNTWNVEHLYGNVLPEVTTADNGKTATVRNGQWELGEASAGGGGEYTLIANTGLTSMNQGTSYNSMAAAQYDLLGIVCLCRGSTAADEYSQIQWFPVPESSQSRKYGLVCMNIANVGSSGLMGEAQTRVITIENIGSAVRITSESQGHYYNWGNRGQDNTCAVPVLLYGMKF